jgi:hypothetical protein
MSFNGGRTTPPQRLHQTCTFTESSQPPSRCRHTLHEPCAPPSNRSMTSQAGRDLVHGSS